MQETCSHLDQIQNPSPNTDGCEECLKMGDVVGAFAPVRNLRPRRLLRLLEKPARHEALPQDQAPHYAIP